MLGRWDHAMLDPAIARKLVLVSAGMEEAYVQRVFALFLIQLGQEHRIDMLFRCVEVMAIAGEASEMHLLVFFLPFVDRQHQEFLTNTPCIR